jgi:hypothetical protein
MADFESPKFLIRQTRANREEFATIIRAHFAANPCHRRTDVDPKTGYKTYKVVLGGPLPDRARHIAASGITDLRHALDQATCIAVEIITGADPGLIYFPFAANPNDLRGRLAKTIPTELHSVFEGFQPYPTGAGYAGGSDNLCKLSKAAQLKHRISCSTGASMQTLKPGDITIFKAEFYFPLFRRDRTNGDLIIGVAAPDGYIDGDFDMTFFIGFQDAGPLTHEPIEGVLAELSTAVEGIVLGLEAETARIVAARGG